uniref:Uncharacterized protein n=1 Tax=Tetranychus urticae TaxID=32264 RepID=T1KR41_TETUR
MVSGNQIIYPKQNDAMKVNERLIRNQNLQRASTLELVMVFMLTLIVSMSIFLLFDILTIRERLNFPGELDRVQVWDMNGFNDDKGKYNDKIDSIDSANSLGSSLFPSAKRKPAHRKSILSDGFKSTQPIDIKTITFPDFDYPISTNVTRKNSFVILRLHSHPPFYQDSTLNDKDPDFNAGGTSLVPFGFNRFNPFDMNSHFSSILISIKPINDTKSKPSGNTINHPKNSTMLHKTSNKGDKKHI